MGCVAERIVVPLSIEDQTVIASVDGAQCAIEPMTNMAGEPRDTVTFENVQVPLAIAAPGIDLEAFRFRGALSRAALMAGAIEKMSQLTVSYTNDRVQFGRPVAKFQAVQQHLVWGAQDAALARMVAETAAREAPEVLRNSKLLQPSWWPTRLQPGQQKHATRPMALWE